MSELTIDLARLSPGVSRVQLQAEPEELGLETSGWSGRIEADLSVERNGERVSVRGRLNAVAGLECVRCLRHYDLPLSVPFEVFAERSGTGSRGEEQELERDHYMMFHDGRRLDLGEEAHDALLLEMPMAPHCRDDCPGLCPRCGSDLNDGPCGCPGETSRGADVPD